MPRARREAGQVLVIFLLSVTAIFGATGIAFDISRLYVERRFLENAADAAALAVTNALILGRTETEARAEGAAVLTRNFAMPPNGVRPALPPAAGSEIYETGKAGNPLYLTSGIVIAGNEIRVAVRNDIPYTFGRVLGFGSQEVVARAKSILAGDSLLPIAVRRYLNVGSYPQGNPTCPQNNRFQDNFATEATSCKGTVDQTAQRIEATEANPGPETEILGQGAQPSNSGDFRGFVTLDIRNYLSASSQVYYNGVVPGSTSSTLKESSARWIRNKGYPGPVLAPITNPRNNMDQVGLLSGNTTDKAISDFKGVFAVGDPLLVLVYSGQIESIPDFTVPTATIAMGTLPTSGTLASAGTVKIFANQTLAGPVTLEWLGDAGDAQNPLTNGTLLGGSMPFTTSPNPVTPVQGSGATVTLANATTSGATPGSYVLWLKGTSLVYPYFKTKYFPVDVRVGTVAKDFTITANATEQLAEVRGTDAVWSLTLLTTTQGGTAFNATGVTLSVEPYPGQPMPAGIGAVSFSQNPTQPGTTGSTAPVTLTINTGGLNEGQYPLVVRATGVNGDGLKVTHLLPIILSVETGTSNSNTSYVDVLGYAVMKYTRSTNTTIYARSITGIITDPYDSRLRRGQVARLSPWN